MKDEITLKEAAEYVKPYGHDPMTQKWLRDEMDANEEQQKRERETGNAGATLDAMLAASRHNKIVRGQG